MTRVLITGMSGTGKSTILEILGTRGHRTIDTDTDRWSHWVTLPDGSSDWIWREQAIADLLASHHAGNLFVAGCKSNQGKFYRQFDHIVLLRAPADVLLAASTRGRTTPTASDPRNEPPSLSTWPSSNHSCGPPPPSRSTPPHRSTWLSSRSKASPDPHQRSVARTRCWLAGSRGRTLLWLGRLGPGGDDRSGC